MLLQNNGIHMQVQEEFFNKMKQVNFRAWDKGHNIMHYDFQFIKSGNEDNDWIIFTSDKHTLQNNPHPFQDPYFQQQFIIMKGYDDKKDINGKLIYEGDIVKGLKDVGHSEVFYDYGVWQPFSYLNNYNTEEFEIIGTIFEPYPWNIIKKFLEIPLVDDIDWFDQQIKNKGK